MPAHLILIRHGQSQWNQEGRFTGWSDVDLTPQGCAQAEKAGRYLADYPIHHAYTSVLKRAIRTLWIMLDTLNAMAVPITTSWRLNERHYGALQGHKKSDMVARYGADQIRTWRRCYHIAPPPRDPNCINPYPPHTLHCPLEPLTESLCDTLTRLRPLLDTVLPQHIAQEENVLIAGHGNSLRACIKYLLQLSDEAITALEIGHAQPLIFQHTQNGWQQLT